MTLQHLVYLILLILNVLAQTNFIINGDFSLPVIPPPNQNMKYILNWNGTQFDLKSDPVFNLGFGQYVDLQKAIGQNGYISQIISLNQSGIYQLQYYQRARTVNYYYYKLEIYWNGVLIATKSPTTTLATLEVLNFTGVVGNNQLKFMETGNDTDNHGMYIDEVILILIVPDSAIQNTTNITNFTNILTNTTNDLNSSNISTNTSNMNITNGTNSNTSFGIINITNSQNMSSIENITNSQQITETQIKYLLEQKILYIISFSLSILFGHITSIKYLFIILQDVWLYDYDKKTYYGTVQQVFSTFTFIEELKFRVLERYLGWEKYRNVLKLSDYSVYSEIGPTQTLVTVTFPYLIYTVPQVFIVCFIMFVLYHLLKFGCIGKQLHRYSFFWWNLWQSLLQGNITYFCFISFVNFPLSFSLNIRDKLSLVFSILFLFILIIYVMLYYFLLLKFIKKYSHNFIPSLKKSIHSSVLLQTICLSRCFIKGAIFAFLTKNYSQQIFALSSIQIILFLASLYTQIKYKVFKSQSLFSLMLIYEFTFLLLNISFYLQDLMSKKGEFSVRQIFIDIQSVLIYTLIAITILRMVADLIPLKIYKKRLFQADNTSEQNTKPESYIKTKKEIYLNLGHNIERQIVKITILGLNNQ